MQIKEVEKLTGISRQNIRFYERKGLLKPGRDTDNSYRLYSEEDVRRLKEVKLFRKLDMPLDELQKLLEGKLSLEEALRHQRERLEKEPPWIFAGTLKRYSWGIWMWTSIFSGWRGRRRAAAGLRIFGRTTAEYPTRR